MKRQPFFVGFEDGREPRTKGCRQLLEHWKRQETDSPLEFSEKNLPVL